MSFEISPDYLPATLTAHPMTDAEFAQLCAKHTDLDFEMTAEGELLIMAPARPWTAVRNSRITGRLDRWAEADGRGVAFDSSGGFVLPNGARRSPDASWTLRSQFADATSDDQEPFLGLCPDFVIELRSASDRFPPLRRKLQEYVENGAQLGWLIDPTTRTVEFYRPGAEPELRVDLATIEGEGPVAGFHLDLAFIWNPRGESAPSAL